MSSTCLDFTFEMKFQFGKFLKSHVVLHLVSIECAVLTRSYVSLKVFRAMSTKTGFIVFIFELALAYLDEV